MINTTTNSATIDTYNKWKIFRNNEFDEFFNQNCRLVHSNYQCARCSVI